MSSPARRLRRPALLSGCKTHGHRAQPHRAAHILDAPLIGHQADDGVGVLGLNSVLLASARPQDVARKLDAHHLHAQAQAEVGHALLARIARPQRSCPRCRGSRSRPAPGSPPRLPAARSRRPAPGSPNADPVDLHVAIQRPARRDTAPRARSCTRLPARRTCRPIATRIGRLGLARLCATSRRQSVEPGVVPPATPGARR